MKKLFVSSILFAACLFAADSKPSAAPPAAPAAPAPNYQHWAHYFRVESQLRAVRQAYLAAQDVASTGRCGWCVVVSEAYDAAVKEQATAGQALIVDCGPAFTPWLDPQTQEPGCQAKPKAEATAPEPASKSK